MRRKPIPKGTSVFAYGLWPRTLVVATLFTIVALLGYYIGRFVHVSDMIEPSHEVGRTMAYVTLAWASVINIMNVRSFNKSLFTIGLMSNKLLFGGICLSLTLVTLTATVPVIREAFHCVPLSLTHWIIMVIFGLTPLALVEPWKFFLRKTGRLAGGE